MDLQISKVCMQKETDIALAIGGQLFRGSMDLLFEELQKANKKQKQTVVLKVVVLKMQKNYQSY